MELVLVWGQTNTGHMPMNPSYMTKFVNCDAVFQLKRVFANLAFDLLNCKFVVLNPRRRFVFNTAGAVGAEFVAQPSMYSGVFERIA